MKNTQCLIPTHANYTLFLTAFFLFLMAGFSASAQNALTDHFVLKVTIPENTKEFFFYTQDMDYDIDWNGDGDFDDASDMTSVSEDQTFTFSTAGIHTIRFRNLNDIHINNQGASLDRDKYTSIEQWGTTEWNADMSGAFSNAPNLTGNYTDTPNMSAVTNMSRMFNGASSFNGNTENWNVSAVTNMSFMFNGASSFNGNTENWNVSAVTNMNAMFFQALVFDQNLEDWDVSSVTNATDMFFFVPPLSVANYNALLIGWSKLTLQSGVNFHGGTSKYCGDAAVAARALMETKGWTIKDGGEANGAECVTIKTGVVTGLTATAAILNGDIAFVGTITLTITERGFVYSSSSSNTNPEIGGKGVSKEVVSGGTTGPFSINISDLTTNTHYSHKVYAISSLGTSYGNVRHFKTAALPKTPVITSPVATVATPSFDISGTGQAGRTIKLFRGPDPLGTTTVMNDDAWTISVMLIEGANVFTATAADAQGNTSAASAAVTITLDTPLLFVKDVAIAGISIYPNPAGEVVRIGNLQGNATYSLSNLSGKTLQTGTLTADKAGHSVDISALPEGVYLLHLTTGRGNVTGRIVKQKVRD